MSFINNQVVLKGGFFKEATTGQGKVSWARNTMIVNKGTTEDSKDNMFIDVVVFGERAEEFARVSTKGAQMTVVGKLDISSYKDSKGGNGKSVSIIALDFTLAPTVIYSIKFNELPIVQSKKDTSKIYRQLKPATTSGSVEQRISEEKDSATANTLNRLAGQIAGYQIGEDGMIEAPFYGGDMNASEPFTGDVVDFDSGDFPF